MPSNLMTRYRVPKAWPTARGPVSSPARERDGDDEIHSGASAGAVVGSSPASIRADGVTNVRPSSVPACMTGVAIVAPAATALCGVTLAGRSSDEDTRSFIISLMDGHGNHTSGDVV